MGYVSDTITLPCEHIVAKADLQAVLWRKVYVMIVAEYDRDDDTPVLFHGPIAARASADVFPPTLKFSNGSLEDAGVYQCEVFPVIAYPVIYRYKLTVNGKEPHYLETDVPLSDPHLEGIVCLLYVMSNTCMFTQGHELANCEPPRRILLYIQCTQEMCFSLVGTSQGLLTKQNVKLCLFLSGLLSDLRS